MIKPSLCRRAGLGKGASGFPAQCGIQQKPSGAPEMGKSGLSDLGVDVSFPLALRSKMQESGAVTSWSRSQH